MKIGGYVLLTLVAGCLMLLFLGIGSVTNTSPRDYKSTLTPQQHSMIKQIEKQNLSSGQWNVYRPDDPVAIVVGKGQGLHRAPGLGLENKHGHFNLILSKAGYYFDEVVLVTLYVDGRLLTTLGGFKLDHQSISIAAAPDIIDAFKKGRQVKIYIYENGTDLMNITTFSLVGFTKAYKTIANE